MTVKSTLLAAAAVLAISPAAVAYEGLYGAIGAGISFYEDGVLENTTSGVGPILFDAETEYDNSYAIYTALGYALESGLRGEIEYSFRDANIDSVSPAQNGFAGATGNVLSGASEQHSVFLNVLYDFVNDGVEGITPYIGGGVGVGFFDDAVFASLPNATTFEYGDSDAQFIYQAIAGFAFDLTDSMKFDVSYRYVGNTERSVTGQLNGSDAIYNVKSNSHNVLAGLRWNFGAAAPAVTYKDCWDGSAVPMSAECPPQLVEAFDASSEPIAATVYFDYDKSNLTPQAATLITEVASRALQNDIQTVVVSGNTDTSGGSAYNQALSERRAEAVAVALVANGVPGDRIRKEAFGETNLAKATPDGTREPLNRRSEIVISFE